MKFKVGDKVKILPNSSYLPENYIMTIIKVNDNNDWAFHLQMGNQIDDFWLAKLGDFKKINSEIIRERLGIL